MELIKAISNNKIFKFCFGFIKTFMTIILLAMLFIILVQRVSDNKWSAFGYRLFSVSTGSMIPKYLVGDVLISKEVKPSEVKVGDDLVYLGAKDDFAGKIITHRVEHVTLYNGVYSYDTKGINNEVMDPIVSQDQIYGVICYKTKFFSFIGELMSRNVGYFTLCTIVAIMVSYQLVTAFFYKEEDFVNSFNNDLVTTNNIKDNTSEKIISTEVKVVNKSGDYIDSFSNTSNDLDNEASKISNDGGDVINEKESGDIVEEL